jgi:hypothetical protein
VDPLIYSGIGSRRTPPKILKIFENIARSVAKHDGVLRSGGADGADSAFEKGCIDVNGKKEIYLPWIGFNGRNGEDYFVLDEKESEAFYIASQIHPNWKACSRGAKKLHARNVFQILGQDLETLSEVMICWTPNGEDVGGTRTAIILARLGTIPILNFGNLSAADKEMLSRNIFEKPVDAASILDYNMFEG